MATQSSTAVMLRALVMLICLVTIPLAALFGKSLPEMFGALIEGRWPAGSASAYPFPDEAAQVEPAGPIHAASAGPADRPTSDRRGPPLQSAPARQAGSVVPAGYESPLEPPPGPESSPAAAPVATVDQFTQIQNRLRQLGATYYLLESWGSGQHLYRFYCKVAVGGSPNFTHCFEATDSDPLRAMARVLQQVETWRTGRQ